jgi:flavin reductase (DIM6/NTAB) family NADH-FMN oxidoreductase RutF
VDPGDYRKAIGHFATGVTVVTTAGPAGLTASAICSLSLDPLLMIVCLDNGSRTLKAVRETGRLAVNVLAGDQQDVATVFATKAGEATKFRDVGWSEVNGVPVLDGVVAWLTGEVEELVAGGDHVIGVTRVTGAHADGGDPLVHYTGGYRGLSR